MPAKTPSAPAKLLIVDDDTVVLDMLARFLRMGPYLVTTADNAETALSMIQADAPDVALLDLRLPNISGLEILQTIRQQYDPTQLPVLILSAVDDQEMIALALDEGANDYILKPFVLKTVSARIRTNLRVKHLEDERHQHIDELHQLDAIKERFFHIAAHDLRSPLTNIAMGVDMLAADSVPLTLEERSLVLANVNTAIKTMQSILSDFMDLKALRSGKLHLTKSDVDAGTLVEKVVAQFQEYASQKQIDLCAGPLMHTTLLADEQRLTQVMQNLISNALKYCPPGSSVTVRQSTVDGWMHFEVEDNGPGIKPDEVPMLFKEFARLSNKPTNHERSSGVGLAITRHLVELHGGQIDVDTEPGRGSRFRFQIPSADKSAPPLEQLN